MTTLDSSSSAAESSMDDNGSDGHNHRHLQMLTKANSFNTAAATITTANNNGRSRACGGFRSDRFGEQEDDEDTDNFPEEGDAEVWVSFAENFHQVQSVLDRNRALIQQVNENHQSKVHNNLVKNVALIQDINANISKVVSLYSDLSASFSSMFHHRNATVDVKINDGNGDSAQS